MKPSSLVILRENIDAQRLASSWPMVTRRKSRKAGFVLDLDMIGEWAQLAGLIDEDAERWGPVLIAHQICLPDGTIDALAEGYIAKFATESLMRPSRRRGQSS